MKALQFKWKVKTGQFQSGESLYLNRIRLGGYEWNSLRSRDDPDAPNYTGSLTLPSLKDNTVFGNTTDEIKFKLENKTNDWFQEALGGEH